MGIVSGGGGGGGPAAGSYLPTAASGVTLDTTTYDNTFTGSGKLRTLVFAVENALLAVAQAGDAFPRWLFISDPADAGLGIGDGTFDPNGSSAARIQFGSGTLRLTPPTGADLNVNGPINASPATNASEVAVLGQLSPKFYLISGALPTVQLVTATAAQIISPAGGDAETLTPVTFNPTAGAAATCKVELSPDNVTYSTLGIETEPAGIAFDGTIHIIKVRVPANWRLKLTVTNATLGLTTYY